MRLAGNCRFLRIWSIYNTSARYEQSKCDTSETRATRVKILITTQVEIYFHTPIIAIW